MAAVYQNNWIDSVLCKISYYNVIEDGKSYKREDKNFTENKVPVQNFTDKKHLDTVQIRCFENIRLSVGC